MYFIVSLLVNAAIILLMSKVMTSITIKSYTTAIWVALVIGILNATVGFLFRLPLNLITLFFLTFIVRLLVTAVMIKIADKLFSGFTVRGFTPALILAIVMAIAGLLLDNIF
jgi:putative membrane protein